MPRKPKGSLAPVLSLIERTRRAPAVVRFGIALLIVLSVLFVSLTLRPASYSTPYLGFYLAVMAAAGLGGLWPGLMATALSAFFVDYFLVPPLGQVLTTWGDLVRCGFFCVSFGVVCWLIEQWHGWEKRKSVESLREAQAIFQAFADHMPGKVFLKDDRGRYLYYNERELKQADPTFSVLGKVDSQLFPEALASEMRRQDRLVLETGKAAQFLQKETFNGNERWWLAIKFPVTDKGGRRLLAGMSLDVTEQKRAEQALLRNEKLASAGRLAATIAHEINNPLEAVNNLLYLIGSNPAMPTELRGYLQQADREVKRIAQIAKHTLGFHRGNAAPVTIRAAALLDEVLELLERKLQCKGIQVGKRYDDCAELSGYAGELRQVFSNLVANSIDAVEPGGRILLRISQRHLDARTKLRITVADDGSGIPRETLPRLFEPFFTTKRETGTGLGLWVTRQIVEKHGGRLQIRSRHGGQRNGTIVSVLLPAECISETLLPARETESVKS